MVFVRVVIQCDSQYCDRSILGECRVTGTMQAPRPLIPHEGLGWSLPNPGDRADTPILCPAHAKAVTDG